MNTPSAKSSTEADIAAPVVLKLGGSLLTLPDLFDRLQSVVERLKPSRLLVIPGGGASADEVRRLDVRLRLPAQDAHRMAIAAMSSNALMLARLATFLCVAASRTDAERTWACGRVAILDAASFLQSEEDCIGAKPLPASWDVTSDSIAAWVAARWPASRLILAKSCDMEGLSVPELIASGRLDAWFSRLSHDLPMDWLNLRSSLLTLFPLAPGN